MRKSKDMAKQAEKFGSPKGSKYIRGYLKIGGREGGMGEALET